jgi:hypothetical protein
MEFFCIATLLRITAQEAIKTIRELKLERPLKLFESWNLGDCWNDLQTEVLVSPSPGILPRSSTFWLSYILTGKSVVRGRQFSDD